MSATEKLRAMLDELGVKWYCPIELEGSSFTRWLDRNGNRWTASDVCGVEKMGIGTTLTPEQAIAATLGSGTCDYKPMWDTTDELAEEYLGMWYTGCGDALIWNADNDGCCEPPVFCPYCGDKTKVVNK